MTQNQKSMSWKIWFTFEQDAIYFPSVLTATPKTVAKKETFFIFRSFEYQLFSISMILKTWKKFKFKLRTCMPKEYLWRTSFSVNYFDLFTVSCNSDIFFIWTKILDIQQVIVMAYKLYKNKKKGTSFLIWKIQACPKWTQPQDCTYLLASHIK